MNTCYFTLLQSEAAVPEMSVAFWLLNFYGHVINCRFPVLFYFFLPDILISTEAHTLYVAFLWRS